ncbi:hypothetical protein ACQYWY_00675 [Comamonas sediminis]|uniref:hypothetical protein n=1 Tax=Comamonas sediminis TaxID=1783360 RepID=UPI003D2DD30E
MSGVESLQGVAANDLGLPNVAVWPIGSLRQTNGGLDTEILIQMEFRLIAEKNSWRTLSLAKTLEAAI